MSNLWPYLFNNPFSCWSAQRNLADTQCQETQYTQSNFTPDAILPQAFPYQSWKIYHLYRQNPAFCVLKYMLYLEKQLKDLVQLKPRNSEREKQRYFSTNVEREKLFDCMLQTPSGKDTSTWQPATQESGKTVKNSSNAVLLAVRCERKKVKER